MMVKHVIEEKLANFDSKFNAENEFEVEKFFWSRVVALVGGGENFDLVAKLNDHPLGFPRRCDRPTFEPRCVKSTVELKSDISFSIPAVPVYLRDRSGAEYENEKK